MLCCSDPGPGAVRAHAAERGLHTLLLLLPLVPARLQARTQVLTGQSAPDRPGQVRSGRDLT